MMRGCRERKHASPPLPGSGAKISRQVMKLSLFAWWGTVLVSWSVVVVGAGESRFPHMGGPRRGMRSMSLEERLLSTDALFLGDPGQAAS